MFTRVAMPRAMTSAPRFAAAAAAATQVRALNVHEYSAKALLNEFGCKTEFGIMCESIDEVKAACAKIKTPKKVVKSQILAGGRGKGTFKDGFKGGVHVCKDAEEAVATAKKMLGNTLITKQTGEKGLEVQKLFVTEVVPAIKRELYCALLLDRATCKPTFIASTQGGMNIEEVAEKTPEAIKKLAINIHNGLSEDQCHAFAKELGFDGDGAEKMTKQLIGIYNLAKAKDATMVEINPLVELENGDVMCIDAKLSFDDNARFRRPEIWQLEDMAQKNPKEVKADKYDLNYIALDGNVGCMVNGAGLAMATMDIISLYGQKPANFLDVGGSAKTEQIIAAFDIISADPQVKVILVNIFGGIMKCDLIAEGIIAAVKTLGEKFTLPLVVRLQGTNDDLGKKILRDSGLKIHPVANLDEAGRKACELAAK
jgi:succinyl-CoA synthetase beta subunit